MAKEDVHIDEIFEMLKHMSADEKNVWKQYSRSVEVESELVNKI